MSDKPIVFRELFSKIPLWLLAPVFYLIFVSSILLYVLLSPFIRAYGLLRCCELWIEWEKRGRDVLIIEWEDSHSREWLSRLQPLISGRAVYLNWSNRQHWDRGSLPAQLFGIFGPHGMPEQFTSHSLPAAIVFQKLRYPRVFTFGARSKNREDKLDQLRLILT